MFQFSACLLLSTSLWTLVICRSAHDFQKIDEKECLVTRTADFGYSNWYIMNQSLADGVVEGDVLMNFYVQTKDNAHIMLSSEGPLSAGYEIVIGGGSNTFSDIRKCSGAECNVFKTRQITGMLDVSRPIEFWIHLSRKSGLIEVGKADETLPFIFWTDPEPASIKYYSFSSWYGSVGMWLFECRSNASAKVPKKLDSTDRITQFLTSTERLRRDVLKQRGKFGIGNPVPVSNAQELLNVGITGYFRFIHLDVMTSTLTLRGQAIFEWMDHGIQWDPQDYTNISKLHLSNYELWRPELVLHNALDPTASLFSESKISVDNMGKVVWNPKFDIKTKCNVDLKSWPWDRHKCVVTMSPWSHKISNVVYEMVANNKSICFPESHSDWKLDKMTSYYVLNDPTPWDDIIATVNDDEDKVLKQISLELVVEISRNTKILEKLFYVPMLLISGLWLSSFCVMPNSSSKVTIICVSIILSTITIVYMTIYVPVFAEFPPDLLLGYLKLMLMMSTDAFVSSFLITVHGRKTTSGHPPFVLTRLLTTPLVTRLLVLPKLEYTPMDLENYSGLTDNDGSESSTVAITLWDVVIAALERLVFATYFVITVIVISSVGIFV